MRVRWLLGSSVVFATSCLLFAWPQSKPRERPTTSPSAQASSGESAPQSATPSQAKEPSGLSTGGLSTGSPLTSGPKTSRTAKEEAWSILRSAATGKKTGSRAAAVRVLGLIPNDARARRLAETALGDEKPEVRTSAAVALGEAKSRSSIPKLREAMDDADPSVALAAAHALDLMHDDSAYNVYYQILTGQRKAANGLIASKTSFLKDPKKVAELGFQEGIGFIPFAGIGWQAFKIISKDDSSPVRAAAAKVLTRDPDPATSQALTEAVGDDKWLVRTAALEALAQRGDVAALEAIQPYMLDENEAVRYTAAAAVVRLTTIKEAAHRGRRPKDNRKKE